MPSISPTLAAERGEIIAILGISDEAAEALQGRFGGAARCLDEWFSNPGLQEEFRAK
jgi:hypothetical protein